MHGITLGCQGFALVLLVPMYGVTKPLFGVPASADEQIFGAAGEAESNGNATKVSDSFNGISNISYRAPQNDSNYYNYANAIQGPDRLDNMGFTHYDEFKMENPNQQNEVTEL